MAWKWIAPIVVAVILLLLPPPPGLAAHAWHFFAIFAAVIVGLMLEPLPGAAVGLIGVTVAAAFAPYTLYGPADLARPGFNPVDAALGWLLSGFSNATPGTPRPTPSMIGIIAVVWAVRLEKP